jgi:hypothetical protein
MIMVALSLPLVLRTGLSAYIRFLSVKAEEERVID